MSTLTLILLYTAACGALSAVVAAGFMLLPGERRNALLPHLVSFATGALLGAALLALLPHALEAGGGAHGIGIALVGGIIVVLRAGEAGAVAALSRGRLRGARADRAPPGARVGHADPVGRRVPQHPRRRADRGRLHDRPAPRRGHDHRRVRARDPAGSRRPRDPAARRHVAPARAGAERRRQPRLGRGRRDRLVPAGPGARSGCRTRSPSRRPASCTWRSPT